MKPTASTNVVVSEITENILVNICQIYKTIREPKIVLIIL